MEIDEGNEFTETPVKERSIVDSLGIVYQFLIDKYLDDLRGKKKSNKIKSNTSSANLLLQELNKSRKFSKSAEIFQFRQKSPENQEEKDKSNNNHIQLENNSKPEKNKGNENNSKNKTDNSQNKKKNDNIIANETFQSKEQKTHPKTKFKHNKSNNVTFSFNPTKFVTENPKKSSSKKTKNSGQSRKKTRAQKNDGNKQNLVPYDPIPLNRLSKNAKKTQTQTNQQFDFENEERNHEKFLEYSFYLRNNFELVSYLTNHKIKSNCFSLWTKNMYISAINRVQEKKKFGISRPPISDFENTRKASRKQPSYINYYDHDRNSQKNNDFHRSNPNNFDYDSNRNIRKNDQFDDINQDMYDEFSKNMKMKEQQRKQPKTIQKLNYDINRIHAPSYYFSNSNSSSNDDLNEYDFPSHHLDVYSNRNVESATKNRKVRLSADEKDILVDIVLSEERFDI
ncbi:hypothetical protein TRFO_38225 [Tritrichomonas foetus]|uniref:Uncharacterized protein n=1 Tax=Tritrichomonas foetus TaxID=1144522 RepID=A0A1J4JBN7_9EUKA|nr:hypothetical protein TRFO_38225 [Tritrichomonas foetus]|eukprot:OHS95655.1 hypothetical protein TRFO_38225 [Tritrichomonas foetus]